MTRNLDEIMALNIGSGNNVTMEYINLDIRPETKADVIADARELPFPDERFDKVFSTDCLEHFSHRETYAVLAEWIRVLKKGGLLELHVPNLLAACLALEKDDFPTAINVLYGAQDYKENFHYMGFTPKAITRILTGLHITIASIETSGLHLKVRGIKQ